MKDITVPPEHKHLLRKTWEKDPDSKMAVIKNYIQNHPGKLVSTTEIAKATDMTNATALKYLRKFMSQGKVSRSHKPGDGKKYIYRWHEEVLKPNQTRSGDGVVTTSLGLPTFPLTEQDLAALKELFATWCDEALPLGDQMGGVVLFRKWLGERLTAVTRERKRKLEGHNATT